MSLDSEKPPMPYWAWGAVALCAILPLLKLGVFTILIGAAGAAGCHFLARNESMSETVKMGACAGVVLVCWIAFIGFGVAVALMTRSAATP